MDAMMQENTVVLSSATVLVNEHLKLKQVG